MVNLSDGRLSIAVRGRDGALKRILYVPDQGRFLGWSSHGGALAADSSPQCVAAGAQTVCYVRTADGKTAVTVLETGA